MAHRWCRDAVRSGQSQRQALLLPGNTHRDTVAGWCVRHGETLSGLVESPLRGDVHGGFGRRAGETHWWQHQQGAPVRPHCDREEVEVLLRWVVAAARS